MKCKAFVVAFIATVASASQPPSLHAQDKRVPTFQLDPAWPKLPPQWRLGDVASVAVDAEDHVWVLHRPRTLSDADLPKAAPPVLEFDGVGNFVQAWGGNGEGYQWPEREHGIYVDYKNNVWIGGNNAKERKLPRLKPVNDDQILKFTRTGKFLMQIGQSDASGGNADTINFHQPADVFVYSKTNEAFVADGYGNHRVIVLDADSGAFKRMWGAFGRKPQAPLGGAQPVLPRSKESGGPQHFNTVHFVRVSNDGLVYVADRGNHRIQVFTLDGKFIAQQFITPEAEKLTSRAVAFSPDPQQEFLYVGGQPEIWVLNRKTLDILGSVASPNAHQFVTDSKGNIYTGETDERRSRKFVFRGIAPSK